MSADERTRMIEVLQRWVNDATATEQADALYAEGYRHGMIESVLRETLASTDLVGVTFNGGSKGHPNYPDRPAQYRMTGDSVDVFVRAIMDAFVGDPE
jgi:hypothetical protein